MLKERGNPMLHFLDRYAGIPANAALGRLRRKRPLPTKIATIGLLRTVAIGDTVLISAMIADLRMAFPLASLIFFAGPSNFEMARMLDGVDKVVRVPIGNLSAGFKAIRSIPVDVMLDFGPWPRLDALLVLFSKASFTAGFRTPGQYRHYGYDLTVEHSPRVHELENYRGLVRALGVKCQNAPRMRVPVAEPPVARNYAVFHPWPGGKRNELKQWPAERWLRLIEEFGDLGVSVVLTGAPSDRERNDALMAKLPSGTRSLARNVAGTSLNQTAALLARARIVVSVNTGVMHIAAALGVPLVALHGPTSSKRWGPISERAIVVDSPLDGCGYLNLGWEYPARPPECMECIRYEAVRVACLALLTDGPEYSRVRSLEIPDEAVQSETGC